MKYAIVQLGGKQFKISEGDTIYVERQSLPLNIATLLFCDGDDVKIGLPFLNDIDVKLDVVEEMLGDKVRVARFKSKSRYRKEKSHRQPMSLLKVVSIGGEKAKQQPSDDGKPDEVKHTKSEKKETDVKAIKTAKKVKSEKPTKAKKVVKKDK